MKMERTTKIYQVKEKWLEKEENEKKTNSGSRRKNRKIIKEREMATSMEKKKRHQ